MGLLAIFTPFLIGSAIIVILFPKDSLKKIGFALTVCLGTGLGLGITSSFAFLWLAYYGQQTSGYFISEFGLALFLVFFSCYRFYLLKDTQTDSILRSKTEYSTIRWLKIFFYLLLVVSVAYYVLKIFGDSPHGKWDAWAIWNFRARWLFRGEAQWTYAFSTITKAYARYAPGRGPEEPKEDTTSCDPQSLVRALRPDPWEAYLFPPRALPAGQCVTSSWQSLLDWLESPAASPAASPL